jgi:hypothetical protein
MNKFALGIVTGVQMRAITIRLICILSNNGSEVPFIAIRMSFGLLALLSRAVITVFNIFLFLKLL